MGDELRDRIAATMDRNFNPDQYQIMSSMFRDYAQAIIDEFGLEVETRKLGGMRKDGAPFARTRVIGKWEQTPDHTTRDDNTY